MAFLTVWPLQQAAGHLLLLALWGLAMVWICLFRFRKIPFTCSWLPGRSNFHMAFLAGLFSLFLISKIAVFEWEALHDSASYLKIAAAMAFAVWVARRATLAEAKSEGAEVEYDQEQAPAIESLHLNDWET